MGTKSQNSFLKSQNVLQNSACFAPFVLYVQTLDKILLKIHARVQFCSSLCHSTVLIRAVSIASILVQRVRSTLNII